MFSFRTGRDRTAVVAPRRLDRFGGDALLLLAAVITAACSYSTTGRFYNQLAVALGAVVLVAVLCSDWRATYRRGTVLVAVLLSVFVQLYKPPTGNVDEAWALPAVLGVTALATLGVAAVLYLRGSLDKVRAFYVLIGVFGLMVVGIVATSGSPAIDVWQIFQQSSAGLLHGRNPYELSFTGIPARQTATCFNYLPATFLSTWPGWEVFGDSRYSEIAVLLAGWAVLARTIAVRASARTLPAVALVALALSLTGTLRVGQQAWNESLLLGFVLLGVCAAVSGRMWVAVLLIGLALATKQHIALLLPVLGLWPQFGWRRTGGVVVVAGAVSAPWFFWNPGRFKGCTVDFFVHGVARFDSISLWHFVPDAVAPGVTLAAVLGAYWLAYRRLPRTPGGLLVAFAVVLYAFDLFNKQSFENQWWLVCQFLVCGLALMVALPDEPAAGGPITGAGSRVDVA